MCALTNIWLYFSEWIRGFKDEKWKKRAATT